MSSTSGKHAETDIEWQEIMAIDADIEPVMWSIQDLRDVFTSIRGLTLLYLPKVQIKHGSGYGTIKTVPVFCGSIHRLFYDCGTVGSNFVKMDAMPTKIVGRFSQNCYAHEI